MPVMPYDARAAEHHAAERARLAGLGKTPSFADGQIAAVSYVNELILVTFNLADFQEYKDLKITDWRG
jgi:tRNA(fMet)-specific endonuclease VapC